MVGWKKIRTRQCAAVSEKKLCIDLGERFDNLIFLDEWIKMGKHNG